MGAVDSRWRSTHRLALIICGLVALAGCGPTTKPVPSPAATAMASPVRTAGVVVRRATPTMPRRATATPALPQLTPREGGELVLEALGLILAHGFAPGISGDLYRAAYDGAVGALRRAGYLVEPEALAFTNQPAEDAARFAAAYARLGTAAGPETNQIGLAYAAIRAATDRLDECNTYLLEPPEYRRAQQEAQQGGVGGGVTATTRYGGIGVSLRAQKRPVTIGAVRPGTPAERAGLRPADAILAIGGRDVAALPADDVAALLRGEAGTLVEVTIRRPGEAEPRTIAVARDAVTSSALLATIVAGPGGRAIGYLRLGTIDAASGAALTAALGRFRAAGVSGWVLDLRESDGGTPDDLAAVAGRFIAADAADAGGRDGGQPVAYRTRSGGEPEAIIAEAGAFAGPFSPLAVLTNGGTGGMAEVLAAALHDRGAARLFGEATAGCVSVIATYPLADGAGVRIGVAHLLSPDRRVLAGVGQGPDETIFGDGGGGDAALEAAIVWIAR